MIARIITIANFRKEAKKLLKKFKSLKEELKELSKELLVNPRKGTPIGKEIYKLRISVKSKGRGKRGGLRMITYCIEESEEGQIEIYLLSIYDKSEYSTISDKLLRQLIKEILQNKKNSS